jgi:hypothetical protein
MTPRQATMFLLWYGEKALAGDEPTEGELVMFKEAREVSISMARKFLRIKPEDYEYTPGQAFQD